MVRRMNETQNAESSQGLFVEKGLLKAMVESCVERVLEEQLSDHLGAERYERSAERRGYRNGRKPRTMATAVGRLEFSVPQTRDGSFSPSVFEHYQRSDKALVGALQAMVIQGVSTRRVAAVLDEMAGFRVSAGKVSQAMAELDSHLERFRRRRLDDRQWPYLLIDARYEKVRVGTRVVSLAFLVAVGIDEDGQREILGYWSGNSESESTWGDVFFDLKSRGFSGVSIVVSDAHEGIRAALVRHMQGVCWQRCRVHFMRELLRKVPNKDYKDLSKELRRIFAHDDGDLCVAAAQDVARRWEAKSPKMSRALEAGIGDCLSVHGLPREIRSRLHSTNVLERLMRELKRRSQVVGVFPCAESLERLLGSVLLETHEGWLTEPQSYLKLSKE